MKIDTRTMHSVNSDAGSDSANRLRWFLIGALVGGLLALVTAGRF
ncbi:hypothetical protein [Sphingomonas carotinifaciens]|nr:hypothetical protein [Sphingomonas carotinifaciens]